MTVHWVVEAIWESVVPSLPDFTVEILPQIDSTNSELMRRARAGRMEPVLLVAEHQTAGRGRMGRDWHSTGAKTGFAGALTFSLGLPLSPQDWSGLSLVAGIVVAQELHPELQLKWPNDVWWRGRKLAGILIETASVGELRYAVIGIGVNIATPEFAAPAALAASPVGTLPGAAVAAPVAAIGLQELCPDLLAPAALARLAGPLVRAVQAFERSGFAQFQTRFAALDALADCVVALSDGTVGIARGVSFDGALLVHTAHGVKKVTSAEVSVRPVPSA